jgi:FKBP-type peptidyl-prolyl cis-trans isomerase
VHKLTSLLFALLTLMLAAPASAQGEAPPIPEDTEVKSTASGLQYSVLQAGNGAEHPKINDTVKVHYTGWLTNGKMFDSSRVRNMPAVFQLTNVIGGWTEGVQLMTPGSRFKFTIPPQLGYGYDGSPPTIPADATLIFDIELIEISKKGRDIPSFRKPEGDAKKTTEGGIHYEVLEAGSGEPVTGIDLLGVDFTIYMGEGTFMNSTSLQDDPMYAQFDKITLPFMAEIIPLLKVGGTVLIEVPYDKGAKNPNVPEGTSTVWFWSVRRKFDVPSFTMPAEEELTTTESGLKYKRLTEGTGASPTDADQVMCHYSGWLTDGTPFDSSYEKIRPATFALRGVIGGWTEGVQLMKEGGKFLFVIPGELGYGARGSGSSIPPDATLVFVIELVKVIK